MKCLKQLFENAVLLCFHFIKCGFLAVLEFHIALCIFIYFTTCIFPVIVKCFFRSKTLAARQLKNCCRLLPPIHWFFFINQGSIFLLSVPGSCFQLLLSFCRLFGMLSLLRTGGVVALHRDKLINSISPRSKLKPICCFGAPLSCKPFSHGNTILKIFF